MSFDALDLSGRLKQMKKETNYANLTPEEKEMRRVEWYLDELRRFKRLLYALMIAVGTSVTLDILLPGDKVTKCIVIWSIVLISACLFWLIQRGLLWYLGALHLQDNHQFGDQAELMEEGTSPDHAIDNRNGRRLTEGVLIDSTNSKSSDSSTNASMPELPVVQISPELPPEQQPLASIRSPTVSPSAPLNVRYQLNRKRN